MNNVKRNGGTSRVPGTILGIDNIAVNRTDLVDKLPKFTE